MPSRAKFTISGPGIDKPAESAAVGLSGAITAGNNAAMRREDATFYVRDESDEVVGYVESHHDRTVTIHGRSQ